MKTAPSNQNHMPQLDGLRAFAVMAVLLHHFLPKAHLQDWALAGVKLFFVLSGFLITGILLKSRDIREQTQTTWVFSIRQFYARRFLRIFPLYYFVIAVAVIINLEPARQILPWLLSYTLNFYMAHMGWFVDHFAHFWTLAVEEQFYIVWPWFILFAPRKWLIPMTIFLISVAPFFRLYLILAGTNGLDAYSYTPACFDTLGMGALLAILSQSINLRVTTTRYLIRWALPIGLVGVVLLVLAETYAVYWQANIVLFDFAMALVFCWLIDSATRGFMGITGAILESRPMTYLGKISYGIYVYHPFMPSMCKYLFEKAGISLPGGWFNFSIYAAATLTVSSLSWYLIEQPINNFKRYFQYDLSSVSKSKVGNQVTIHKPGFVFAFGRGEK